MRILFLSNSRFSATFICFVVSLACTLAGCSDGSFTGSSSSKKTPVDLKDEKDITDASDNTKSPDNDDEPKGDNGDELDEDDEDISQGDDNETSLPGETIESEDGAIKTSICSRDYEVAGKSNPYLAGAPNGTQIAYSSGIDDKAPSQSPQLVIPKSSKCLQAGGKLYFKVSGELNHGPGTPVTNADGNLSSIEAFEKGAYLGKSGITAPMTSLLGVFIKKSTAISQSAPENLDFTSASSRNYKTIEPKLGQVFYIGDGKTSAGKYQKVIVPLGADQFYFGIMDSFGWWNNTGSLTGSILWEK